MKSFQKSIPNITYLFVLQDLLLGEHCCLDIMGSTQFKTPRANWDKRCCSNSRGPVVEIPDDVSEEDANKINKQIARMPNLKQVCTNVTQVMRGCTDLKKIWKEMVANLACIFS